jgi:broad specificity phosphatase PhoE
MRARQTAQIVAFRRKLAVITTKALRERSFGAYEGTTGEQYEAELKKELEEFHSLPDKEKFKYSFPSNIEGIGETVGRVITWLREISVAYPGKKIMAVAHGGVLRLLLIHLGYGTYQQLPPYSIANTAYIILECDGVDFKIKETVGVNKHEG